MRVKTRKKRKLQEGKNRNLRICLKSIYLGGKVRVISFTGFVLKILMAIFSYDISRLVKVATVSYHYSVVYIILK